MSSQIILSDTVNALNESATLKMAQLARDLNAQGRNVISLSIGEPDFDTPQFIIESAKKALDDGYTHYTPVPGLLELRQAICRKFKRDNDLNYEVKNIVVSNGAKQTIYNLCRSLINPGDEVIVFAPYWVSYIEIIQLCGGIPVILEAQVDSDYKVTPDQLQTALNKKTKFILFSSPCNPTGSIYTRPELSKIADVLTDHPNVLIVSDEIYEHIVYDGKHESIAQFPSVFERTVVVNGMSKGFAMTGWRLGYMAAPAIIADACTKIQGQVTSGASSFGQKAAVAALDQDLSETKKMTAVFLERRDMMLKELRKIDGMKLSIPTGAFYIFPDCSAFFGKSHKGTLIKDADILSEEILMKGNVGTVSGVAFGAPNCIRLSYAASKEDLMEAARRLQNFFAELN